MTFPQPRVSFQSLFFWIHFYDRACALRRLGLCRVSILVFLDSLLRPGPPSNPPHTQHSFNPCFSGFTSTTSPSRRRWTSSRRCFNPCFSGFTSTTVQPLRPADTADTFQSLFFWIHFYDQGLVCAVGRTPRVSILVFLDSLLRPQFIVSQLDGNNVSILVFLDSLLRPLHREQIVRHTDRFQSLFFWIHFYDVSRGVWSARWRPCFNPCFSGFTSTTRIRTYSHGCITRGFNPCFSGFTSTTPEVS